MTIPFDTINAAALSALPSLVREWLPAGKFRGREYVVGDLRGAPGESLSINIQTGQWADFAADQKGGDPISLYAAIYHHGQQAEAARELAERLGVVERINGHKVAAPSWQPILAPPTTAGIPDLAGWDHVYTYRDPTGRPMLYVCRREQTAQQRKQFSPRTYGVLDGRTGWHAKHPTTPRPLYGLDRIAAKPTATIIVCEGEKAADAAADLFPAHACVSWMAGAQNVERADWAPLRGRAVIIWPDNDEEGIRAAEKAARLLRPIAATTHILRVGDMTPKGDAADLVVDDPDMWLWDHMPPEAKPERFNATPFDPDSLLTILPRQWVYGHFLIRKFVSVLGAPGGTGKTAYIVAVALSVCTGTELLKETVHEHGAVWIYNLEDPRDELLRRVAAAVQYHQINPEMLRGNLYLDTGRERPLVIAQAMPDGSVVALPVVESITAELKARGIRLLVVDPFVKSHRLEENRNDHIDAAATLWSQVADQADCSIALVHHFRKGGVSGDASAFRGASALIDASRAAISLATMAESEAERFNILEPERRFHIRADNAKLNLAPPPEETTWVRLESVDLPNGDKVQTVSRWEPPSAFDGIPMSTVIRILDRLAVGPSSGEQYTIEKAAKGRWAGLVVTAETGRPDESAKPILTTWIKNGLLVEGRYYSPTQRREVCGLTVNRSKLASMTGNEAPKGGIFDG